MAVISGQKRSFVKEINLDGVITETELTQRISDHITSYHGESVPGLALPYTKDTTRGRYLGNDLRDVLFYDPGSNKKNVYLFYVPSIVSSTVPFIPPFDSVLIGVRWRASNSVTNAETFQIRKNGVTVFTGSTAGTSFVNNTLNILVSSTDTISVYLGNISQNIPVVNLTFARDYGPVV